MTVLLLHPGAMGASIGAALVANGHDVSWVSADRSQETHTRAADAGLRRVESLADGVSGAEFVISVCPPEAAMSVARSVRIAGFQGTFVDGNAIAPATAAAIESEVGVPFVDGGIIGPPARRPGLTRFYLSGTRASQVASLFQGTLVDARIVTGAAGAASALKMCYAAYTKGSSALLLGVRALAKRNGVSEELLAEWDISQPGLADRSQATAKSTSAKAWRFAGEMREIAATFKAGDLPSGFHEAAAEIYERMADLKDVADADIHSVMTAILEPPP